MSNEALIQPYENTNVRIVWDEEKQDYYFSVADIVQILTDSADVKQHIKRMRSRTPNSIPGGVQFVPLLECSPRMASIT